MLINSLLLTIVMAAQPGATEPAPAAESAPVEPAPADDAAPTAAPTAEPPAEAPSDVPADPAIEGADPSAEVDGSAPAEPAPVAPEPELPAEPTPLRITSTPSGATVYVDGVEAGVTPFEKLLEPGDRLIEVQKDGHVTYSDFVTIDPATPAEPVSVTLVEEKSSFPYEPLGWAGVGAGAAVLISGIALIAIDENPYKGQCVGEDIDSMGRCRYRYNTLAGGITGVIVGAALAGGGAALLVLGRKRGGKKSVPKDSARAHLRWGVSARGVSLSGRF